jgi:hypothetical protein
MQAISSLFDSLPYQPYSNTSQAAAVSMTNNAGTLRRRVLWAIRDSPDGLTDEEIQDQTGMNPSTERPRRIELVLAGLVRNSGRKRRTRSNRLAVVWEIAK